MPLLNKSCITFCIYRNYFYILFYMLKSSRFLTNFLGILISNCNKNFFRSLSVSVKIYAIVRETCISDQHYSHIRSYINLFRVLFCYFYYYCLIIFTSIYKKKNHLNNNFTWLGDLRDLWLGYRFVYQFISLFQLVSK
jgi:hypothetical protein